MRRNANLSMRRWYPGARARAEQLAEAKTRGDPRPVSDGRAREIDRSSGRLMGTVGVVDERSVLSALSMGTVGAVEAYAGPALGPELPLSTKGGGGRM